MKIVIVDYGMGNVLSIANMLKKVGVEAVISTDRKEIEEAPGVIIPGVGHFQRGMEELEKRDLIESLGMRVEADLPVLGICLGMQLMTEYSEEGNCEGLGWFPIKTLRFESQTGESLLRVPHMGWNRVEVRKDQTYSSLFSDIGAAGKFYFVHSYHVVDSEKKYTLCTTRYGDCFASGIVKNRIIGVQFHPEKSHRYGRSLLHRFTEIIAEPTPEMS
jgi:imidazole glycerol-phosphate synthase subunit HisH